VDVALIANRNSGGSTDQDEVTTALEAHGARLWRFDLDPGSLRRAERADVQRIVVVGGDGSIGPAASVAARLDVPLAVIPTGTANDFARSQQIPVDVPRAAALAIESDHLRRMDLGRLSSGCPFVNVANTGISTTAAREAAPLKRLLGPVAYGVGAVRAASKAALLPCRIRVDGDELFDGKCWQVLIGVTGAFGGGSEFGPGDPRDGLLDVAVLPAGSRLGLVRRAWGLRVGSVSEQADVLHRQGCAVELDLPPGTELNVDGEVVTAGRSERVTLESRAFALVVS
jgi:diacylglycerol kinase (ATP)